MKITFLGTGTSDGVPNVKYAEVKTKEIREHAHQY